MIGVNQIKINDVVVSKIDKNYEDGEILGLKIFEKRIELSVNTYIYPPEERQIIFDHIICDANKIEWIERLYD